MAEKKKKELTAKQIAALPTHEGPADSEARKEHGLDE